MRAGGGLIRAAGLVTTLVYVCLPLAAIAGLCGDRPHLHGGIAAPDCAMHHGAAHSPSADHAGGHAGHTSHAPESEGTRVGCACASDLLPLVTPDVAPVEGANLASRAPAALMPSRGRLSAFGLRRAPLPPPPRPSRS